ncbi:unnamed protein product [Bursaphelenchus xylophilus]|uniref:(pine wood nematode) hypothetical protein n=1 Tax=Bursaphelenchus xylophilus TaxID=6326 RepID=A0A1I7SEG8_BURXY|nr:unnamed protein product [Bursaphelenchus xylophilus]CAG9103934.1 unnamed protein product [Bursaphelenchus xylophilus]
MITMNYQQIQQFIYLSLILQSSAYRIPESRINIHYGSRKVNIAVQSVSPLSRRPMYTATLNIMDGSMTLPIMAVADMDEESPSETMEGTYVSPSVRGFFTYNLNTKQFSIDWQYTYNYTSRLNYEGRGMELSDLKTFNGYLYSVDDKTGVVFRLTTDKAIPWVINPDGDGFDNKTFKTEWMTIKDEHLWIGGYGKEYTNEDGSIRDNKPFYIKIIDRFGVIQHVNWEMEFKKVRASIGIQFPAYMIHEAVQWSDIHRKWFFLPRRASFEPYTDETVQFMSTNYLISTDENFETFEVVKVGNVHPTRGFSAFQFVPGSQDNIIVAIKSEEVSNWPLATYIMVFGIDGQVYMDETKIPGDFKLEGLEFFDFQIMECC